MYVITTLSHCTLPVPSSRITGPDFQAKVFAGTYEAASVSF